MGQPVALASLNSLDRFLFVLKDGKYGIELRHPQLRVYLRRWLKQY
jgi:hypothetical protein